MAGVFALIRAPDPVLMLIIPAIRRVRGRWAVTRWYTPYIQVVAVGTYVPITRVPQQNTIPEK